MKGRMLLALGCLLLMCLLTTGCAMLFPRDNNKGERTSTPDRYCLSFSSMSGEDEAVLMVGEGDALHCVWSIEKGHVDISVVGGDQVYRGNDIDSADFLLSPLKEGEYRVRVKARRAKGNLEISLVTR